MDNICAIGALELSAQHRARVGLELRVSIKVTFKHKWSVLALFQIFEMLIVSRPAYKKTSLMCHKFHGTR